MAERLLSLMKRKYGITKSAPLTFTENDTLFTQFRKLSNYIYKNGEWTEEDIKHGIETNIKMTYEYRHKDYVPGSLEIDFSEEPMAVDVIPEGKAYRATIRNGTPTKELDMRAPDGAIALSYDEAKKIVNDIIEFSDNLEQNGRENAFCCKTDFYRTADLKAAIERFCFDAFKPPFKDKITREMCDDIISITDSELLDSDKAKALKDYYWSHGLSIPGRLNDSSVIAQVDYNVKSIRKQYNGRLTSEEKKIARNIVPIEYRHNIYIVGEDVKKKEIEKFQYVVDPQNKSWKDHGLRYLYGHFYRYTAFNESQLIGYDKLIQDILKEYRENPSEKFSEEELGLFLTKLTDKTYAGKTNAHHFQKSSSAEEWAKAIKNGTLEEHECGSTSRSGKYYKFNDQMIGEKYLYSSIKKNNLVNYVNNYIEDTYSIILQQKYEIDVEKQSRARPNMTKKNINQESVNAAITSKLNRYYRYVELDNDVDLDKFKEFEHEAVALSGILPKPQNANSPAPELRLRKLGNYHAYGCFFPGTNTIVVDFRTVDDRYFDGREVIGGSESPLASFTHEYGHYLDYNNDDKQMSLGPEYSDIVREYRENLKALPKGSPIRNNYTYYGTPTEVFARNFELYVSKKAEEASVDSSLFKTQAKYAMAEEYQCFTPELREKAFAYMETHFPNIQHDIVKLKLTHLNSDFSKVSMPTVHQQQISNRNKQ